MRGLSWAIAAALAAMITAIAATGASGTSLSWGQWRGTVKLEADLQWYSPGDPNGQGGLTYHTMATIVWRFDQRPPPDPDGENDGNVAAGSATMSYTVDDIGEPHYCDDIAHRSGSLEVAWQDMLVLDGSRVSSKPWVDFTFEQLGQPPNLDFALTTEHACAPPDVSTFPATMVGRRFRVTTDGWAGGVLIDRNRIVGRTRITCDDWMETPPRVEAECDPPSMERGWMKSVYTITVVMDREAPPARCVVPKVLGLTLARARAKIRATHCTVGQIRHARSTKAKVGRVVAQTPRTGTVRPNRFAVKLVVGRR